MDTLKVLGQSLPATDIDTLLYAVPALTSTTTSSLVICNQGTSATFRVWIRPSGVTTSGEQYLFYDVTLAATTTQTHVLGMTLTATDEVYVRSNTGAVSFNLFGVETK